MNHIQHEMSTQVDNKWESSIKIIKILCVKNKINKSLKLFKQTQHTLSKMIFIQCSFSLVGFTPFFFVYFFVILLSLSLCLCVCTAVKKIFYFLMNKIVILLLFLLLFIIFQILLLPAFLVDKTLSLLHKTCSNKTSHYNKKKHTHIHT